MTGPPLSVFRTSSRGSSANSSAEHYLAQDPLPALWGHPSTQSRYRTRMSQMNEALPAIATGRSASPSRPSGAPLLPSPILARDELMLSSPAPRPLTTIAQRMLHQWDADLNSAQNPFVETRRPTGSPFGPPPSPEYYPTFQRIYVWYLTAPYALLLRIMMRLSHCSEQYGCSMAQLELESPEGLGLKQDWMLILRIPAPSSGAVTRINNMLLLTNFVEESTSPTSYDGSIVTRFAWKSKDLVGR